MFRLMLLFSLLATTVALPRPLDRGPVRNPRQPLDIANPQDESIALFNHLVATNVTNSGYWGIDGFSATPEDTVYCDWRYVPGLEYPFGSGIQLLFQAALWIGAEIETDSGYVPRVSVGSDGWQNPSINEFHAGQRPNHGIILRSNLLSATDCYGNRLYDPSARANYEAISVYTDTLTDPIFVEGSPIDGDHLPLGLEVTQTARLWVNPEYSRFVIHEFRIRNIGAHNLRNVYLGLYTDSDIGRIGSNNEHTDDLSGSILVDSAQGKILGWSADNDGYPVNWFGQQALATHHALGIVAMTNQFTTTDREFAQSFNWWSPNANISLDLGPSWEESPIRWEVYGSPGQDADRYYLLSNRERDYDQAVIFGPIEPQVDTFYSCVSEGNFHLWRSLVDTIFAVDLVDGNDTRFLLSYGPLGELDHFDDEGQCVTRLSPGEEFTFTVAQLAGHNFHDPEHPQPLPYNIDTTLFDFTGLLDSYHKAQRIYNSNYEFQPMPPVENLRVPRALDSAVPLRWDPPGFGNPYGYLVAGNPHSGASDTVLFTPTPIQDRTYTVTELDNDSHWQFIVIAVDSEGNQVAHDTIVHVGAIPNFSELHGKAFAHGDSLWWDVSNDPLKAGYTLVRTSASDTVTYSSILTRTFLDTAVVSGRAYTYRMYIDCVTAVQSEPTNAITLTPYRPTANILIFDETRRPFNADLWRGEVADTSVRVFYENLFTALGEPFDYFEGDTIPPQAEQLARYDIVFSHQDNYITRSAQRLQERNRALSDYVAMGGRLIQSGRMFFYCSGIGHTWNWVEKDVEIGTLTFDSVFAARLYVANPRRTSRTTGVTAIDTTFPSFRWDSVKVQALIFGNNAVEFLPEIDLMWPNGDTRPIYTAILHESDSTGYVDPPCAVIGPRSMLFGFPLYFAQMSTAMGIMAASLEALRTQVVETPEPPAPLPSSIALHQNYPNPFNATTVIEFELPAQMEVALNLYNIRGQLVRTLFDGAVTAGHHRVMLNGEQLASGLYFYRLQAAGESQTKKLLLLK